MSESANVIPGTASLATVPTLWVKEMMRSPEGGAEDRLTLTPGVNVLVGVPNTGKSRWLRMLDYLLGDDKKADEAFGEDVANKYDAVSAVIVVAGEEWTIERQWKQEGLATKITVNGELMTKDSFTLKLMSALQIPIMHYPQGDPYGSRTWPELSWRSIYRHMYRRQLFWGDLADKQPESEQHACILLFVGIAEVLFSEKYGQLVVMEKKIQQLQNQKEHFIAMLQEVSRELIDEKELGVALTPESINTAVQRYAAEIAKTEKMKQDSLRSLLNTATSQNDEKASAKDLVTELGKELASLRTQEESNAFGLKRTKARVAEMQKHRSLIAEELGRMKRAAEAGNLLADLKITHCPACDQPVERTTSSQGHCYLCHRTTDTAGNAEAATKRIEFEVQQLDSEVKEIDELLAVLEKDEDRLNKDHERIQEALHRVRQSLRPVQAIAASVLPPELAVFDQDIGRLNERVSQLKRVQATLERRELLAADIKEREKSVAELQSELDKQSAAVNFETAGDLLTDGMNTYLNAINAVRPNSWTQQGVNFIIRDRSFAVRVGTKNWHSKLGGTLSLFFLIAYHYALMTLTTKARCHFPGFCVLDFPPQLDGVTVSDTENFVLEPFVSLLGQPDQPPMQIIAAGSSFAGIEGANRIQFTKVWI